MCIPLFMHTTHITIHSQIVKVPSLNHQNFHRLLASLVSSIAISAHAIQFINENVYCKTQVEKKRERMIIRLVKIFKKGKICTSYIHSRTCKTETICSLKNLSL